MSQKPVHKKIMQKKKNEYIQQSLDLQVHLVVPRGLVFPGRRIMKKCFLC
jgi:hypothetical protein